VCDVLPYRHIPRPPSVHPLDPAARSGSAGHQCHPGRKDSMPPAHAHGQQYQSLAFCPALILPVQIHRAACALSRYHAIYMRS
jgi:hypothetical protein